MNNMRYVRSSTVLYGDHFYFNTADAGTKKIISYKMKYETYPLCISVIFLSAKQS